MNTMAGLAKLRCKTSMLLALNENNCSWYSTINSTPLEQKSNLSETVPISFPPKEELHSSKKTEESQGAYIDNSGCNRNDETRVNDLNIQMLPKSLHSQIFGKTKRCVESNPKLIEKAKENLKRYGLGKPATNYLKDVTFNLPPLRAKDIEKHFWIIGEEQSKPYRELLSNFVKNGIPDPPTEWLCQKGWTKYVKGEKPLSVPFPDDDILVFDVEVNVKLGESPTLATAVSSKAWYGWVCSNLEKGINPIRASNYTTDTLIPFEGKTISKEKPRVIVGHSVSYDRARIKEQYSLKNSALRFIDTMALHICNGGLSKISEPVIEQSYRDLGKEESCFKSLKELYALYCNKELVKEQRNVFMTGLITDVKEDFQNLINYCAGDVKATYEVLQALFSTFLKRFPHPVSLAGMLEMSTAILPVNSNWNKFINEAEQTFEDFEFEKSALLSKKCDEACKLFHDEQYKRDLWLWSEDWNTSELKFVKSRQKSEVIQPREQSNNFQKETEEVDEEIELFKKFQYLFDKGKFFPKVPPLLPGYPNWYRNLCEKSSSENWTPKPVVRTGMNIAPKLLKLSWENFPLHYLTKFGWGILVANVFAENVKTSLPFDILRELTLNNCNIKFQDNKITGAVFKKDSSVPYYTGSGIWCNQIIDDCSFFFKLPQANNKNSRNVGTPFGIDLKLDFSFGIYNDSFVDTQKIVELGKNITYWRNNRDRILNQMVVWLNNKEASLPKECDEEGPVGIIVPKVVVCGTLTRRAKESTWLTVSRVVKNRIGSEMRSMIQAPPGYHFVGADVDSQELWIASLIGDSYFAKEHGCTPLGWMTLSGSKANGTDLHSVTAKAIGISRDQAKIINYSRFYGAGTKFAGALLKQFNQSISETEATSKANSMIAFTKGVKGYEVKEELKSEFFRLFGSVPEVCDLGSATRIAKYLKRKTKDVFHECKWINGTESAMFNQLEKIAKSPAPVTPFLGCRLSKAMEPRFDGDNTYLKTRINWIVQSGAVDFLHLMLVCMKWLTNGKARYCFSFHDEVRYLIPSNERYSAALALHITNLLVRSFCASRLGMNDLPYSVAFFSSVEIDKTLRKEANDECITHSNPHGLEKGYGIPPGESLTIYEATEKSGGDLSAFQTSKTKDVSSNKKKACSQGTA